MDQRYKKKPKSASKAYRRKYSRLFARRRKEELKKKKISPETITRKKLSLGFFDQSEAIHSSYYNIRHLEREKRDNESYEDYFYKNLHRAFLLPLNREMFIHLSGKPYNAVRAQMMLFFNILDVYLNGNTNSFKVLEEHYKLEILDYLKRNEKEDRVNKRTILRNWLALKSIIDGYEKFMYRPYILKRSEVVWSDGINTYYDIIPLMTSEDGNKFDIRFIVFFDKKYFEPKGKREDLLKIPSIARCLGSILDKGVLINTVTIDYLEITSGRPLRVYNYIYRFYRYDEYFISYLKVLGNNKNWYSPLVHLPKHYEFYDDIKTPHDIRVKVIAQEKDRKGT